VRPDHEEERKDTTKKLPNSKDEEEKDWSFPHLDQVLTEITSQNTGIGGILAAMIYQIDNNSQKGSNSNKSAVPGTNSTLSLAPSKN